MDSTTVAAELLEPVPANRLFGLRVRAATPEGAAVELEVRHEATNVIGSLHASGLAALVDATGLAAILGTAPSGVDLADLGVLGAAAELRFLAPARGLLVGRCVLDDGTRPTVASFFARETERASVRTLVSIEDASGAVVCTGHFDWRLRRNRAA